MSDLIRAVTAAAMLDGAWRLAVLMRARALRLVPTACSVCL